MARHLQFENYPLFMANRAQGALPRPAVDHGRRRHADVPRPEPQRPRPAQGSCRTLASASPCPGYTIDRQEINETSLLGAGKPRQMHARRLADYYSPEYESATSSTTRTGPIACWTRWAWLQRVRRGLPPPSRRPTAPPAHRDDLHDG